MFHVVANQINRLTRRPPLLRLNSLPNETKWFNPSTSAAIFFPIQAKTLSQTPQLKEQEKKRWSLSSLLMKQKIQGTS
jgi:hypothetical protein